MVVKNHNREKTINPNLSAIINRLEERGLHALKLRTVLNWFDHVKGKVNNAESKSQNLDTDGEHKTRNPVKEIEIETNVEVIEARRNGNDKSHKDVDDEVHSIGKIAHSNGEERPHEGTGVLNTDIKTEVKWESLKEATETEEKN